MLQGATRDLGDRAGHLDAGGAAADNHEGEETRPLGRIFDHLRPLEGEQEPPPDLGRVRDVLEAGRERLPIVTAEIGMGRSRGEHEIVVGEIELASVHAPCRHIDPGHPRHNHADVLLVAHDGADRPGHIGGRERRRCDLIEERLKAVVVVGVDERHVDLGPGERLGRLEPAKTCAYNQHLRPLRSTLHAGLRPAI